MKIGKKGIMYTKEESINISNKGEKILKDYHSKGKCMYCECNDNSINSHTISEKESLSTISIDNKVGCFGSRRRGLEKNIIYNKEHINNATTFRGFCSTHDNQIFKCIDNNSEIKIGKEILLQSYRSICRSLFYEGCYPFCESLETLDFEMIKEFLNNYDDAFKDVNLDDYHSEIMNSCNCIFAKYKNKLLESRRILLNYKESIEKDIKNNFYSISSDEVSNTKTKIIKTSDKNVVVLYKLFDWQVPVSIFNHHRLKGEKSVDCILNFTYVPYENSAEVFWIFSNKDFTFFYDYWNWFVSKKINVLNTVESCMMTLENWCINPQVIDDLSEERRKVLFKDMYFNNERTEMWKDYDMSIFDKIRMELIKSNMCDVKKENAKFKVPFRKNDEIREKEYKESVFNDL